MNILDALADRKLFAPHFATKKGQPDTWAAWRVFLAALFALPMDDAALAIYMHHTGRTEAPTEPFREASLICGRRGGKSRVLALIATYLACFIDYTPHLSAGEVATIGIIANRRATFSATSSAFLKPCRCSRACRKAKRPTALHSPTGW